MARRQSRFGLSLPKIDTDDPTFFDVLLTYKALKDEEEERKRKFGVPGVKAESEELLEKPTFLQKASANIPLLSRIFGLPEIEKRYVPPITPEAEIVSKEALPIERFPTGIPTTIPMTGLTKGITSVPTAGVGLPTITPIGEEPITTEGRTFVSPDLPLSAIQKPQFQYIRKAIEGRPGILGEEEREMRIKLSQFLAEPEKIGEFVTGTKPITEYKFQAKQDIPSSDFLIPFKIETDADVKLTGLSKGTTTNVGTYKLYGQRAIESIKEGKKEEDKSIKIAEGIVERFEKNKLALFEVMSYISEGTPPKNTPIESIEEYLSAKSILSKAAGIKEKKEEKKSKNPLDKFR